MFTVVSLLTFLAPELDLGALQKPAALPDRWQLKLLPDKLPELPAPLEGEWHDRTFVFGGFGCGMRPSGLGDTRIWFRPGFGANLPGHATVERWEPLFHGHHVTKYQARTAVHGPLIEFAGELYTARVTTRKEPGGARRELLLGSTLELPGLVWYRAGTSNGGNCVEEWRAEFREDPRTNDEGVVTIRTHWRFWSDVEGMPLVVKAAYKKPFVSWFTNSPRPADTRLLQLALTPIGKWRVEDLPRLTLEGRELRFDFDHRERRDQLVQLRLIAGPPPTSPLDVERDPLSLVQPPKKR
ncbi:hypothetical protein [Gemmata sp.]|uniref:hypothetical protein n=1 Tax=Gemmata sp. TaxID=1914242 RepID=UPI003F6E5DF9